MSSQSLGNHRHELESRLITKALQDETFRQELLNDPKTAIAKEWGITLPDAIQIHVHEETAATLHLVLPVNPNVQAETPLSEAELEAVVGGRLPWDKWYKEGVPGF